MDLATALQNINWLSVFIAALSAFLIGGIWYGPFFGKAWMKAFKLTDEDLKKRNLLKTFGGSFALAFVASLILEMFIGQQAGIAYGAIAGLLAGVGWVATFIGILYLFEMQSLKVYLINSGYCVISLTVMGTILGSF